jgi:adenosylcobyric acid synthase
VPALTLMVVGTASSAGKSLMVTALCRIFRRRGWSVAPFKSQNMSNFSFVTPEGGEISRAQAAQAEAAGVAPSVLMNPILLKPTTNRTSQVIVGGRVRADLSARDYYAYKDQLWPEVLAAFQTLAGRHQAVIIEGAGSPAEINLQEGDFVNLGLAARLKAPALLIGDIDRGGVFAALYGTVMLMPPPERACLKGLVINKFRGDPGILAPGLRRLEELLGLPMLGVLPYEKFDLDEEDSLTDHPVDAGPDAAAARSRDPQERDDERLADLGEAHRPFEKLLGRMRAGV